MSDLIQTIASAISQVRAGALVAVAGASHERRPLALVRELRRQRGSDVRLVGWADGPESELLGSEPLHLVPVQAFQAAALGIDFLPTPRTGGPSTRVVSPISGEEYDVIAAVRPDVLLIHAEAADEHGNVLLSDDPLTWGNDRDLALASARVIVSVERLVSPLAIAERSRDRLIDGSRVAAIVHAPFGAHPLAYAGEYPADDLQVTDTGSATDHWSYLDAIGVSRLITRSTTTER